jgi:hypothetical protein
MVKQTILAAAVCALAGCAAPQQTATTIPPSPTGCYYRVPGSTLLFYGLPIATVQQPRYDPAPCNVVNANQPIVVEQGGSQAPPPVLATELQVPDASVALPHPQTQFCFGAGAFEHCQ